jgi:GNAT superfamily N-acetyltransferase
MRWRAMTEGDLDAVSRLAAAIHPSYPEKDAIAAERLRLYPAGCLICECDGPPAGYAVTHPWRLGAPPKLDSLLHAIPQDADTYYLHDVALATDARGTGAASQLIALLASREQGRFPTMSLVAVNGSAPFWARHGFVETTKPALTPALASYGSDAAFMVRMLA